MSRQAYQLLSRLNRVLSFQGRLWMIAVLVGPQNVLSQLVSGGLAASGYEVDRLVPLPRL